MQPVQINISVNKKFIVFWLFILFSTSGIKSQSLYDAYTIIDKSSTFDRQRIQVDSLLEICKKLNLHTQISKIAGDFGKNHWQTDIHAAIDFTTVAIEAIDTLSAEAAFLATLYFRRGFFHYRTNDNENAILDYKKVITLNTAPARTAQSYCGIGQIYLQKGDYYEAIHFYEEGIRLLEEENDFKKLANQYVNLSIAYEKIGNIENLKKKLEVLDKSEALKSKVDYTPLQERNLNNSYAVLYSIPRMFNFNKAKHYYNKNIQNLANNEVEGGLCDTYINLADIHNYVKNDSAQYFIQQGLSICEDSIKIAKVYDQRSQYYLLNKDYAKAINSIQKTLHWMSYNEEDPDIIPSTNSLNGLPDKSYLIDVFQRKAHILFELGIHSKSNYYLNLALENIKISDALLIIIQSEDLNERSRFYWQETAASIYSQGMAIAYALNNKETAFYFMQRNKAVLLTSDILANIRKESLPDSVIQKERGLQKEILTLQAEIEKTKLNKNNLESHLFDKRERFKTYQDSLKAMYPNYYSGDKAPNVITLEKAQKMLSSSTAMVSYFWGDNIDSKQNIYGLLLTNSVVELVVIDSVSIIANHIENFKKGISKPFKIKKDKINFQKTSHTLFNLLFPFDTPLVNGFSKMIIIPDGALQNIPFEAFIIDQKTKEYLIRSKDISYGYSMSFINHNKNIQRQHTSNFIGFAPIQYSSPKLYDLPHTEQELETITDMISGASYFRDDATKDKFLEASGESKIIHLATHADASTNPGIAFYDKKLKLHELYTFQNRAELVVLSACNTSIGENSKGEGIISLTRGFFYSGANTVVSNAWTLNDKSASYIMKHFYENIAKGKPKSKALQDAKLAYIDGHSLSEVSPFYWASLLLMGDNEKIHFESSFEYGYSLLLIPVLLVLLFMYKKR